MPAGIPAWQAKRLLHGALDNAHHLRRGPPEGQPVHTSIPVDLFTMPDAVEDHVAALDVETNPVWPNLQAPLAHTFALEPLDAGRRAKRGGSQYSDRLEHSFLNIRRQPLKIALEARREQDSEMSRQGIIRRAAQPGAASSSPSA